MFIPASQLKMHSSPEDIGPVDWVLVALKSTSLSEAASLIKPLLKQNLSTRVFAIMNGLVDEDLVSSLVNLDGLDNHNTYRPAMYYSLRWYGIYMLKSSQPWADRSFVCW